MRARSAVPLSLRRAGESDRGLLFEWINDPLTRQQSFSTGPVSWETHCAWLAAALADPQRLLYILLGPSDEPVGQVRFEPSSAGETVISVALAPSWRGRGLAAPAIRLATSRARRDAQIGVIHAYIRPDNQASCRAFARAGYLRGEPADIGGSAAVHFTHAPPAGSRPGTATR